MRWSITDDPDRWGICGFSSGGNCAFTAAWLRPDVFRRVICCLSSFAQMPDGNPYPALIPEVPRKPLRILMQGGPNHGGVLLPDALRWVFRPADAEPAT